ncbi:hypothetical protein ARMGADRAFT_934342, partial [Armillaria gallica]
IVSAFCEASSLDAFKEAGCAVCGQLTPMKSLNNIQHVHRFLDILDNPDVTQKEHFHEMDPVTHFDEPVIDKSTSFICLSCCASVCKGIVPHTALSNGLWIGEVPDVLKKLSFVEKLLVAQVCHNCCFVKVSMASSGHPKIGPCKMISYVILFESPVAKIYDVLPSPHSDLDEVLAILFTGPNQPTEDDLKYTPLLVHHNIVINTLTWLCHNHIDYRHVKISTDNLNQYTNNSALVEVIY